MAPNSLAARFVDTGTNGVSHAMTRPCRRAGPSLIAALVCLAISAQAQPVYVKRGTARATWEASTGPGSSGPVLGPWYYTGPFDHANGAGFDAVYPPERAVDLSASYRGKGGRTLRWLRGEQFVDGQVNSLRIFDDNDWIAVYLFRTITVPVAQELPVLLGSDDTITVWLNGTQLLAHNVTRACTLGDERLTLRLRAGENDLLMKICQGEGGSGFAFAQDVGKDSVLAQIARDFPTETNDLLLELDWVRQCQNRRAENGLMAPEDDAPGGCDGIEDGGTGFHTAYENQPWWQVDLGQTYPLDRAVLYNRSICPERNNHLIILLSDDGKRWQKAWQNNGTLFHGASDGKPMVAPLKGERARLVRLTLPGTDYLHLDEVEVYGTEDPRKDLALNQAATQSSTSAWSTYTPRKLAAADVDVRRAAEAAAARRALPEALDLAKRTLAFVERTGPRPESASELKALEGKVAQASGDADWKALYLEVRRLRRRIILSHPLLAFDRLLLVKRPPPLYSHMVDQYEGRHSRAGDGLIVLDLWRDNPKARALLEGKLPRGAVLHPELSYDAKRVIFSYCDHTVQDVNERRFFIYEADMDGSAVRQLTGKPGVDLLEGEAGRQTVLIEDYDPCYLPGGGFLFVSTRNQGFGRCHGGRYTPSYVLYRADADGSSIRRISYSEANEWTPSVLPNGLILYTRWDYINRINTFFQSLWTTRPDGTGVAHYYKNNTRNPCMAAEAQPIPGSSRIVATACAHHSFTAGSIIMIDRERGEEGLEPVARITPDASFPETEGWPLGNYATPWPLSEDLYLAAYSPDPLVSQGSVGRENAYAIYLVDTLGGRELVYQDPSTSCWSPIPVQPRAEPPVLASTVSPGRQDGTFLIQDIYRCVEPLDRGSIKRLRVVRIFEQPTASVPPRGAVDQEVVKGVIGTVPVSPEGSVAFRAPARMPLLFQLLDENNMSAFSMRSQVYLQPGETMSCVGCHEPRGTAPSPELGLVSAHAGDITTGPGRQYDGGFSFARTMQPVLDRYCIRCHGLERTEAGLNLLGTPTNQFSVAYESLVSRPGMAKLAHPYQETDTSKLKDYGAHAGRLAPFLLTAHKAVAPLDPESFACIAEWLDLNGQYYGDYSFERHERREPVAAGVDALRGYLRAQCRSCHASLPDQPLAALVSIALPEESRVLQAPLAQAAGGWGQCREAWPDTSAAGYGAMREKVIGAAGP